MSKGIALDLGSSGFRAQAIDLTDGSISSGAATAWHPLPGGNVIDHILFAMTYGRDLAHRIVIKTINDLTGLISKPDEIEIMAVCGNPIQLSLFTGGEIRDLALSPDSLARKGIDMPLREAQIVEAGTLGINAGCDVLVPPSIKGEVGADCIAMIKKSGMIEENISLAIDFGTNAEMALKSGRKIYVGSAAAGPAIEGQHISHGMLASPGAICDLEYDWGWRCRVLDEHMEPKDGDIAHLASACGRMRARRGLRAAGITGTGVIALVSLGIKAGYIDPPRIATESGKLSLQDGIGFDEADLLEVGKAFGAIRAGQMTLAESAGRDIGDIEKCFMAGAAGYFADPYKARDVGLIPESTKAVCQIGNTSLQMAFDLVFGRETLEGMQRIADMSEHVSFSSSPAFKQIYLSEYAYWCEGARRSTGRSWPWPEMRISRTMGKSAEGPIQYCRPAYFAPAPVSYRGHAPACPKKALVETSGLFEVDLRRCLGASCLRCESTYPGFKLGADQG